MIAAQPYDASPRPTSTSQIAKLKSSGADTLAIFATPMFAVQAYAAANKLGWKPKHVINNAVGLERLDDVDRVRRRPEQARQRHDLDRVPEGPERPAVGKDERR